MKNQIIILLFALVLLSACAQKQETSTGTYTISIKVENSEVDKASFSGRNKLWSGRDLVHKNDSGYIVYNNVTSDADNLFLDIGRANRSIRIFVEKGQTISLALRNNKLELVGDTYASKQTQIIWDIQKIRSAEQAYNRKLVKNKIDRQKGLEVEDVPPFEYAQVYNNVAQRIEQFKKECPKASEFFLNYLELDNKYYLIHKEANLPRYLTKTYHDFGDEVLASLSQTIQDAKFDGAILSIDYRQALSAYMDYLRINDPEGKLGDGREFLMNELRLSQYVQNPNVQHYLVAHFLKPLMFSQAANPVFIDLAENYTGIYGEGLMEMSEHYRKHTKPSPHMHPNFGGVTPEGDSISISDFKGKWIYVDIWATWCGPCNFEIPYLKHLEHNIENNNLVYLGVSVDKLEDTQKWKDFIVEHEMQGVQILCTNKKEVYTNLGVTGIPHFAIIDPDGKLYLNDAPRPSTGVPERILKTLTAQ